MAQKNESRIKKVQKPLKNKLQSDLLQWDLYSGTSDQ